MSLIQIENDDGVAVVTLNRSDKHNALNAEMMVGLAEAWDQVARDESVRVVLLTGAGEKAFCAGADLGSLAPLATGARLPQTAFEQRWVDEHQSLVDRALLRNTDFLKPVVAAVNGLAVAAGFELMLGADIRVASSASNFQLSEVRHGLIPSGGGLARLPRQIGWANAMEIILAATTINAERALSMGLVNRLVAPPDVRRSAKALCARIAEGGPLALRKAKEAVVRSSGCDLQRAFQVEQDCQAVVMASADAREGPAAFMERRAPQFTGR
ncbi:enoyl-CoA hydratase-related protein [Brevundimonas sp.]|uniref:enoyl-CoA hydratase/isomerase family protein n=1 Tax=Brevundimonas sp. TaxID=1871086 RepID=UPI00289B82A6|nr:enoyl-CoA hydratase-related protein [Brevundimonas sp.]